MTAIQSEDEIENYVEVIHALVQIEWLQPDGNRQTVEVDNARHHDTQTVPSFLRVSVPRKGPNYKVCEVVEEMGLVVGDVWQYENDKEDDRIMMKVEPEDEDNE